VRGGVEIVPLRAKLEKLLQYSALQW